MRDRVHVANPEIRVERLTHRRYNLSVLNCLTVDAHLQ